MMRLVWDAIFAQVARTLNRPCSKHSSDRQRAPRFAASMCRIRIEQACPLMEAGLLAGKLISRIDLTCRN
jgi:hypothetical protein